MSATTPATMQGQYAGFVTRFFAFLIDILLINIMVLVTAGVVSLVFGFFSNFTLFLGIAETPFKERGVLIAEIVAVVTASLLVWLYPIIFWMVGGQTIGKRIMGLRVVRMDGTQMTFWRGIVRVFGYILSAIPLFLGFIWVLFSNKRRGWHDSLAGTCVIYSWEARGSAVFQERLTDTSHKITDDTGEF